MHRHWLLVRGGRGGSRLRLAGGPGVAAERDREARCRPDCFGEYRALPVRVVSCGPRAGGCWPRAALRALPAPLRGSFIVVCLSFISCSSRKGCVLYFFYPLGVAARLTPIHPSKPISGGVLLVAFVGLWPPGQDPCFMFNMPSPDPKQGLIE